MPLLNKQLTEANRSNNTRRRIWLTAYAPLIVWTIIVLGLGSGLGAANETSRIIRPLLEFIFPTAAAETISTIHGWIRKFAHFAEYALLGWLACRAFIPQGRHTRRSLFLLPVAFVTLIAVADETNQSFTSSRTASVYDVLIDLAGGALSVLLFALFWNRDRAGTPVQHEIARNSD